MVRLLTVLFLAAAAWYGWRTVRRHRDRFIRTLRETDSRLRKEKAVELERDPETGVYRPSDRRE